MGLPRGGVGRWAAAGLVALILLALGVRVSRAEETPDQLLARIKAYHGELTALSAHVRVANENDRVLSKISPDFAEFVKYGFRQFDYYYKSPDKVRMESNALLFHALRGISIRNGNIKNFYVPALHIHKTADVTGQANKKETSVDWGLITGDVWVDYNIWYMRTEKTADGSVYVIGMQPKNEPHGGTMIVRLDAATLRMTERERYDMVGVMKQRQVFSNYVHPLPHVWIPTTIKLYNNQGQFAGNLEYNKVTVNPPLSDRTFGG